MPATHPNLVVILGPTASGKTSVAAHLAAKIDGEIISADSRQVYRNLNLGTGKDYDDYIVNGTKIPYHMIDNEEPGSQYNVFEYQKDFIHAFDDIIHRGKFPILCGGSGMYIEAVIRGYRLIQVPINQELRDEMQNMPMEELTDILKSYKTIHNVSDSDTKKRIIRAIEIEEYTKNNPVTDTYYPKVNPLLMGIRYDRFTERRRITDRLQQRLDSGMIDEVKNLLQEGITPYQLIYYGLEYKFLTEYITGVISYDKMFTLLNTAIHQFAKRQMTWFRRMERQGMKIWWLDGYEKIEEKTNRIIDILESLNSNSIANLRGNTYI